VVKLNAQSVVIFSLILSKASLKLLYLTNI
jgi:hypothetical protein